MVFYVPLAVITWLSAGWLVDRRRLPQLFVYGLFGAVLATLQDRLMAFHQFWEYRDLGPIAGHAEVALLISLSAAPLFAMRFVQALPPGAPVPWLRVARFTGVAMLPEMVGLLSGHVRYHNGWNLLWSVLAYVPIWTALWGLHRWLTPPVQAARRPQRQTAPGT